MGVLYSRGQVRGQTKNGMTFLTWEQRTATDERRALYSKIQQAKGPNRAVPLGNSRYRQRCYR